MYKHNRGASGIRVICHHPQGIGVPEALEYGIKFIRHAVTSRSAHKAAHGWLRSYPQTHGAQPQLCEVPKIIEAILGSRKPSRPR